GRTRALAVRLTADGMAWITTLATPLHHRLAGRPADVVIGILRASGRRTAASWFRGPSRIGSCWRFPARGRSAATLAGWAPAARENGGFGVGDNGPPGLEPQPRA